MANEANKATSNLICKSKCFVGAFKNKSSMVVGMFTDYKEKTSKFGSYLEFSGKFQIMLDGDINNIIECSKIVFPSSFEDEFTEKAGIEIAVEIIRSEDKKHFDGMRKIKGWESNSSVNPLFAQLLKKD